MLTEMPSKILHTAQTAAGEPIKASDGVVPILEEVGPRKLKVVGTGFYITRFGLFMTSSHVFDDVYATRDEQNNVTRRCFVLHNGVDGFHLRVVRRYHLSNTVDLAIAHAENYLDKNPETPLVNLAGGMSIELPAPGEELVTYAYPENEILDFSDPDIERVIKADYYDGVVIEHVDKGPHIPYPHFRSSIEIRCGASGGPMFC